MLHPSEVQPGSAVAVVESASSTHGSFYVSFVTRDLGRSWSLLTREQVTAISARYPGVMYSAWSTTYYEFPGGNPIAHERYTMRRSDDDGGTWRDASGGADVDFHHVLIDAAIPGRAYATVRGVLCVSDSGGL
jgi:hypothetical protein